jgi:hypothetical protein
MIPISIADNRAAIQMAADRMNELKSIDNAKEFRDSLEGFGKASGDAVIIGRLKQNEDDEAKLAKINEAIENGDSQAIRELTKDPWYMRAWDRIKQGVNDDRRFNTGNRERNDYLEAMLPRAASSSVFGRDGSYISQDVHGLLPNSVKEADDIMNGRLNEKKKYENFAIDQGIKEKERLEKSIKNKDELLRAAETAGINTGYIPSSEKDKMEIEQKALADKMIYDDETANIKGAFAQLTENDNKAQSSRGSYNAALRDFDEWNKTHADSSYNNERATRLNYVNELKHDYINRKSLADSMAESIAAMGQSRFGYINDYVAKRGNLGEPEPNPIKKDEKGYDEKQKEQDDIDAILNFNNGYKERTAMSDGEIDQFFKDNGISNTPANKTYFKQLNESQTKKNIGVKDTNRGDKDYADKKKAESRIEKLAEAAASGSLAGKKSQLADMSKVRSDEYLLMAQWVKVTDPNVKIQGVPITLIIEMAGGNTLTPAMKTYVKSDFARIANALSAEINVLEGK